MKLRTIGNHQSVLTFKSGVRLLFSYETPCAVFVPGEGYKKTSEFVSRTTQRHIADWVGDNPVVEISQADIASYLNASTGRHEEVND
ncbi:hypothetical protein HOR67_gp45 [Ralstonia phage RS-PI-1]|uniref:DUF8033 domain-containing protein n=1 Tax=Ralstonia phage RS-PI-1 TaxID=1958965 RepID=A0A1S6L1D8_9CAUD|nr:hypothetical protein HOR67_gp45 [Ralstonia phage RS-PI-1]AQT27807.1 hypothetical protein [Ralstonia phage RS-PI-1]